MKDGKAFKLDESKSKCKQVVEDEGRVHKLVFETCDLADEAEYSCIPKSVPDLVTKATLWVEGDSLVKLLYFKIFNV